MTDLDFIYDFSDWVNEAMHKQGVTKSQLAKMSGLSKPTITRVLSGDYMPTVITLNNICYALDLDIYDILPCDELIN